MARDVPVNLDTTLPLTCTREGACCHGNVVRVTPWETARLANALGQPHAAFVATFCDASGTRLRFDAAPDARGLPACRLYGPTTGCTVHAARPLACRLYPLARQRHGDEVRYFHRGPAFPCLATCPGVRQLPGLTATEYLRGQDVADAGAAQDLYLELLAHLADGALVIFLDGGLAASGDRRTLPAWRRLARTPPERWAGLLPVSWPAWREALLTPPLRFHPDPRTYAALHAEYLQGLAQHAFGALVDADALVDAAVTMMALTILTAHSVGADVDLLVEGFCRTARAPA